MATATLQTQTQAPAVMTLAEFQQRWESDGPFEFINGVMIPMPPTKAFLHGETASNLVHSLNLYLAEKQIARVYSEVAFILPTAPDLSSLKGSRIPDVMVIDQERLAAYKAASPEWRDNPLALVPDLVVEIISPSDIYEEVKDKIAAYFQDGVKLVWLIEPKPREVNVYHPGSKTPQVLSTEDTLEGENILPGFKVEVAKLFAG